MPKPRYTQVSLDATRYYHCVSRCVRRAYLCGEDFISGRNYDHRRQWIEDRLYALAEVFALDICAYAVMTNHYHVVLHVDAEQAAGWSRDEVIFRWHRLFRGHMLSRSYTQGDNLKPAQLKVLDDLVSCWRDRLMNISWFMRIINESIARRANAEDQCSGHFWEGRFRSQALLDESALISCMAYVDLNPIRARLADTPETSDFTSIKYRCRQAQHACLPGHPQQQIAGLMTFIGAPHNDQSKGLTFGLTDYLLLLDWSGRLLRQDKSGVIDKDMPEILNRLGIEARHWNYLIRHFESRFKGMVGGFFKLKQACKNLGYRRVPGAKVSREYFASS